MSSNPTKTRGIEKAWNREINKRWRAFKKSTVERLRESNRQAMIVNEFALDPSQIRAYMVFLESEIQRLLIETEQAPNWQASYQLQSYERGLEMTRASLISQGAEIAPTAAELELASQITTFTATPTLGTTSSLPIHQDALEFLYQRSYTSLKGWTDKMALETRQILIDGAAEGQGIDEIVREMVKRQDVSRSRARVIAQTETIQAFQRSSTNETKRASEEIGEEIGMRWLTVRDSKVRHRHASWHGTIVSPGDNMARINVSPWNCRCGQAPVIAEADTAKKRAKFKAEREQLLAIERNG